MGISEIIEWSEEQGQRMHPHRYTHTETWTHTKDKDTSTAVATQMFHRRGTTPSSSHIRESHQTWAHMAMSPPLLGLAEVEGH